MKNRKALMVIILISLIVAGILLIYIKPKDSKQAIKFGVSEGVPSIVANKLLSYYKEDELKIEEAEIYSFQDC